MFKDPLRENIYLDGFGSIKPFRDVFGSEVVAPFWEEPTMPERLRWINYRRHDFPCSRHDLLRPRK